MSYNIDTVESNVIDAWMTARDVVELSDECELPSGSFLEEMQSAALVALKEGDPNRRLPLPSLEWRGEWSGRSFQEVLQERVVPKIRGRAEAILIWEGGDSVSGLLVNDGKFAECKVVMQIVKPDGWD